MIAGGAVIENVICLCWSDDDHATLDSLCAVIRIVTSGDDVAARRRDVHHVTQKTVGLHRALPGLSPVLTLLHPVRAVARALQVNVSRV